MDFFCSPRGDRNKCRHILSKQPYARQVLSLPKTTFCGENRATGFPCLQHTNLTPYPFKVALKALCLMLVTLHLCTAIHFSLNTSFRDFLYFNYTKILQKLPDVMYSRTEVILISVGHQCQ